MKIWLLPEYWIECQFFGLTGYLQCCQDVEMV